MIFLFISTLFFGFMTSTDADCCVSQSLIKLGYLSFLVSLICGMMILYSKIFRKQDSVLELGPEGQQELGDNCLWLTGAGMICFGASQWLIFG